VLLTLTLPRIGEYMTTAVIKTVYAAEGDALAPGAKLLDLSVDLSAVAPHDCPPIMLYRLALRDRAWLRRLAVAAEDEIEVGTVLARFSTEPDEPIEGEPARAVRIAIAGIVGQTGWWEGSAG
jgi:pyruvate/2-oxoglutarate dehydrogenase complex dihydrolipoamide acyltransferase (E2) component